MLPLTLHRGIFSRYIVLFDTVLLKVLLEITMQYSLRGGLFVVALMRVSLNVLPIKDTGPLYVSIVPQESKTQCDRLNISPLLFSKTTFLNVTLFAPTAVLNDPAFIMERPFIFPIIVLPLFIVSDPSVSTATSPSKM